MESMVIAWIPEEKISKICPRQYLGFLIEKKKFQQ